MALTPNAEGRLVPLVHLKRSDTPARGGKKNLSGTALADGAMGVTTKEELESEGGRFLNRGKGKTHLKGKTVTHESQKATRWTAKATADGFEWMKREVIVH